MPLIVQARPEGWFPAYGTAYDNRELFECAVDPQFALTQRCSQVNAELTLRLAEGAVVPQRVTELSDELQAAVDALKPSIVREMSKPNISLGKSRQTVALQLAILFPFYLPGCVRLMSQLPYLLKYSRL
ncbi:hypothetical protein MTO96_035012 [Rhipicephalus appendiculatus]